MSPNEAAGANERPGCWLPVAASLGALIAQLGR
jgi:hypothetical protein